MFVGPRKGRLIDLIYTRVASQGSDDIEVHFVVPRLHDVDVNVHQLEGGQLAPRFAPTGRVLLTPSSHLDPITGEVLRTGVHLVGDAVILQMGSREVLALYR